MNKMLGKKFILLVFLSFFIVISCFSSDRYLELRRNMVTEQIINRGVKDKKVIKAMLEVPRHEFVPFLARSMAYIDSPLKIGKGQTISQPYIVALMTELLKLQGDEKVLEIGTGSGYQAAILGELAKEVYTIEIIKDLADRAEKKLKDLGYENIKVKYGDGYLGWQEYAPYDAIIVTAAPSEIPQKLVEQLKEGGRMVVPVGEHFQELKLVVKNEGKATIKDIISVRFVPMVHGE